MNNPDAIFQPLEFRNLTIRNRLIRSSLTPGLVDHYDGTGTEVRINFEVKYARTGLGAIISGFAAIHDRGVIAPGHAHIDRDDRIPFWRELVRRVHKHECPYIIQLLFAGRQREVAEMLHYEVGLSSTDKADFYRGTPTERMTTEQIGMVVDAFGQAARRAREAGADGVEIHGANGFLLTQFLSKAINDRTDEYGGSLENRARLPIEVVREVRKQVGDDFHVQFKISAVEHASDLYPWLGKGNTIEDSMRVCKWLEEAGVDAFHVSTGIAFPNPRMPPGKLPLDDRVFNIVSVRHKLGVLLLHTPLNALLRYRWEKPTRGREEGLILPDTAALKSAVRVPVICGGGFQTASVIRSALEENKCDAVAIGRPLLANPDLPTLFAQGIDRPANPCVYSNKCLKSFLYLPVGCYEETRYESRDEMVREIMSNYEVASEMDRA